MASVAGCWLGFGKREFCEDLGLLSFNLARKALIREGRKRFWHESGGVAAGFGARASREGRGRVDFGGAARDREGKEVGSEALTKAPAPGYERTVWWDSAGRRDKRRSILSLLFSLRQIICFPDVYSI